MLEYLLDQFEGLTDVQKDYLKTQEAVLEASGLAPSIFETWRASIYAAAAAAGELTEEMRELLELIDELEEAAALAELKNNIQTVLNITGDFVDGFRAFQDGDIVNGIKKTGGAIAEIVGLMNGIPGMGAMFEQAFEIVVNLLGDMSNGVKQVRAEIEGMQRDFTFFDANDLVVTERVSRGGLLGLFGLTKEAIDEDLTELNVNIAQAIESGMSSGFTAGIREFMISGLWDDLSLIVKDALLNGLIEAYMQSEIFKQMFGDALAAYIKDPSKENAEAVLAGIPAFEAFWEQVREDWGDFFGDLADSTDTGNNDDLQVLRPIDQANTSMVAPLPSINPVIAAPSWLMEMGSHVTRFGGYVDQLTNEGIRVNVNQGVGKQSMKLNSGRTAVS
ncbi:MAG: hypothetical protein LC687_05645 [Actinobacteria bacterium]|nr:hypothetical protein [Actinomycetota bacterium]MCA1807315.1 hypothetical protein [Actinomycetota bacterium]